MKPPLPLLTAVLFVPLAALHAADARPVYVVPNFHPASCGWLTDWSTERNYCANSYFDHLDRVRDDPNYRFAFSECNNLIAMLNFRPDRAAELQQRIREGRVELCNAFFLEPDINLSGGEALVKCGVEGLRWQQAVWGVRPRLAWMIDVTGLHEQMAQITAGLGLAARDGSHTAEAEPGSLGGEAAALWSALDREPRGADEVARRSGVGPGAVLAGLMELELLGLVERRPGRGFARRDLGSQGD